jgi:expansin (peptidoglycan-binding protein)
VEFISYIMQVGGVTPIAATTVSVAGRSPSSPSTRDFGAEIEAVRDLRDMTIARVRMHGRGLEAPMDQTPWHVARVRHGQVIWWRFVSSEADALEATGLQE